MSDLCQSRFVGLDPKLAQNLGCPICKNIFREPLSCDCGHTFCRSCLEQYIMNKKTNCPECRKCITTRKASQFVNAFHRQSDGSQVVINRFIFIRNIKISGIIDDLKIKCDFGSCDEVVYVGLLSAHQKVCPHRLCVSCGHIIGKDHNCIQLLRKERDQLKSKCQTLEKRVQELEANERQRQSVVYNDLNYF